MLQPKIESLPLSNINKPRQFRILEEFTFWEYKVPAGFVFNGASVPKAFWGLVSPTGLLFVPAIIHDYAYQNGYLLLKDDSKRKIDRALADKILRNMALELHGNSFRGRMRIAIAYYAVRSSGWVVWRNRKEK